MAALNDKYVATKARATSGAKALAIRHGVVALLTLGGSVYLIRELGPAPWAAYSVGYYLITFFDQNFGASFLGHLIRAPSSPTRREVEAAAWLAQVIGAAAALLVAAVATPAGSWYGSDDLTSVLFGVALCIYVYAVRSPSLALLERRIDYHTVAAAEILDQAGFYLMAVPLVASGAGVGGLAVALALRGVFPAVLLRLRAPAPFLGRENTRELRTVLSFGTPSIGIAAVLLVNGLVPLFVLGGEHATELAFTLTVGTIMGYPALFLTVAQRVGFPSLAELQSDPVRFDASLQRLIDLALGFLALTAAPLAATSPIWLAILFGSEWAPAGVVAAVFTAGLLFAPVSGLGAGALNSLGRPRDALVLWLTVTAIYAVAAVVGVQLSVLLGVAAGFAISRFAGGVLAYLLLRRRGHAIGWARGAGRILLSAGLSIGGAVLLDHDQIVAGSVFALLSAAAAAVLWRAQLKLIWVLRPRRSVAGV